MKASYCLISQPWIPCSLPDGTQREFGLAEALCRAHEITAVSDPSPPVTISLHRLLLAVLHRVFGPRNSREWRVLWDAGRFDGDRLEAYFTQWKHRFDLFDEERPFCQVGGVAVPDGSVATDLVFDLATRSNLTLFDHTQDRANVAVPAAKAARALLAQQSYCRSGMLTAEAQGAKRSGEAGHLRNAAVVLVTGPSLFGTLALNLVPYDVSGGRPWPCSRGGEVDAPLWEQDQPRNAGADRPRGYLDYLTWAARRVRLAPEVGEDGSPCVCKALIANGASLAKDAMPLLAYEQAVPLFERRRATDDDEPFPPLRLSADRVLWRDSDALLGALTIRRTRRPAVLDFIAEVLSDDARMAQLVLDLSVFGLCCPPKATENANIIFWRQERQPLPLAYLSRPELVEQLGQHLVVVERVGAALRAATEALAKESHPKGHLNRRSDLDEAVKALGAMPAYWSALEPPFHRLVVGLAEEQADTAAIGRDWTKRVCKTAQTVLDEAINGLRQDARTLRAATAAQRLLMGCLHQLITPLEEVNHAASD